jgi:hypothetical protein
MTVRPRSAVPLTAWLAIPLVALAGLGARANAETLEVTGYVGVLGEWELTARVMAGGASAKDYAGPVRMRHVGYCTQEGPEERNGQIRLTLLGSSRLTGTLSVNGVECSYSGRQTDTYVGSLKCPDRRAVPLTLFLNHIEGQ